MNQTHFSALLNKHSHLDTRLASETRRPMPDAKVIADLKKRKLRLKDALEAH